MQLLLSALLCINFHLFVALCVCDSLIRVWIKGLGSYLQGDSEAAGKLEAQLMGWSD